MLTAVWRFRHFTLTSIFAEFKGRYTRSKLGLVWSVLYPLAQTAIYALVLGGVLGARLTGVNMAGAFPIYLIAGVAAWNLFSEILTRSMTVFVEYGGTLKKIAFPRICLPIIVFGGALLNHVLLLCAAFVIFLCFGHYPAPSWLALPLGIVLVSMFGFGLGVLLGIFNVFLRDIGHVMTVVLQLWFWLTPIVYTADIIPQPLHWIVDLNPMAPLVRIYQDTLLFDRWPDFGSLGAPFAVALILFVSSFVLFRRTSAELVDAL
jgi:lipopolysaccharide transport system permease protein